MALFYDQDKDRGLILLDGPVYRGMLKGQAVKTLEHGSEDAQWIAYLALKYLGCDCYSDGKDDDFYWQLDGKRIDPDNKPTNMNIQNHWTSFTRKHGQED